MKLMEKNNYFLRGASSDKEDVHQAIRNLDKGLYPGAFCKILPDMFCQDPDYAVLIHADGAGTKSALAYMYWRETGDLSVWKGIAQDALVMNTDDLMCVGLTDGFLCSSTIGRNKHLIPGEVIAALIEGNEAFLQSLRDQGIEIINGGGETADIGDVVRTVVVDSNVSARIKRSNIIDNKNIGPDQVIVGLASDGQAKYETEYTSGIGSNGLTAARHDLFSRIYLARYPETANPQTDADLIYCGKYQLTDPAPGFPLDMGKMVLSPTRTYLPVVKAILQTHRNRIKGLIHCTGGGQTKCLNFVENTKIIKNALPKTPWIFDEIQTHSRMPLQDMYKIYNMGIRLEIYTDPEAALEMIDIARQFDINAYIIGYTEPLQGKALEIQCADKTVIRY